MKVLRIGCQILGSLFAIDVSFTYAINAFGNMASDAVSPFNLAVQALLLGAVMIVLELVGLWLNYHSVNIVVVVASVLVIPLALYIDLEVFPSDGNHKALLVIGLSILLWIVKGLVARREKE